MAHLINIVIVNFGMVLQMALLRWLNSQSEEDRMLLAAVTSVQVGKELLNRITNQDKVDAYKVPAWCWSGLTESVEPHGFCVCVCVCPQKECILGIAQFLREHPRASQADISAEVEKRVLVFAAHVRALETAPIF